MTDAYVQCAQIIHRFYAGLDQAQTDTLLECVRADTVWHRKGQALTGPDEIRQALGERNPERITVHQVSNLVVQQTDDTTATATYYLSVYDNQAPNGAIELKTILRSTDRYTRRDGQWWLAEKRSAAHFK